MSVKTRSQSAIHRTSAGRSQIASRRGLSLTAWILAAAACVALPGCGSSTSPVNIGPIAFTDANGNQLGGAHKALTVGTTIYVDAALSGKLTSLGIDWTVDCGSAPPPGSPLPPGEVEDQSCGSFTPVHTATAPVPQYATSGAGIVTLFTAPSAPPKAGVVTLFAAPTGDHSKYSTVTLTILGLPISIAFAPNPPSALPVSGTTSLKAVLSNDYSSAGAQWTVTCGSSDCGSFSSTQTGSGVATTFMAPATTPVGGSVVVTATSVTDSTKSVSATISILPVAVTIAQAAQSVAVNGTDLFTATVTYDVSNAGADWTLSCGAGEDCGTITAHTASGIAATYTAPANVPGSGVVQVTAASTGDPAANATATVTITTSSTVIRGQVRAGTLPVSGAAVYLYASGSAGYGSAATLLNARRGSQILTGEDGSFEVAAAEPCPNPASGLYVVAQGGNPGAGENQNLVFIAALGPCRSSIPADRITVNEVTTVASAYALNAFIRDAADIGAVPDNLAGLTHAFAGVSNLVDLESGEARSVTPAGNGLVPETTINAIADILDRCSITAGGAAGDGSACGNLFSKTGGTSSTDTLAAALSFAQQAGKHEAAELNGLLNTLGANAPFLPVPHAAPDAWDLAVRFPDPKVLDPRSIATDQEGNVWIIGASGVTEWNASGAQVAEGPPAWPASTRAASTQAADPSGNLWVLNRDAGVVTEFVGHAEAATMRQKNGATGPKGRSAP